MLRKIMRKPNFPVEDVGYVYEQITKEKKT